MRLQKGFLLKIYDTVQYKFLDIFLLLDLKFDLIFEILASLGNTFHCLIHFKGIESSKVKVRLKLGLFCDNNVLKIDLK